MLLQWVAYFFNVNTRAFLFQGYPNMYPVLFRILITLHVEGGELYFPCPKNLLR